MITLSKPKTGFFKDRRGNVALMTALLAPALLMGVGAGIDFSRWSLQRANLKEVADTLATRGAREFLLASATEANIKAVINAAIANDIGASYGLGAFAHLVAVDTSNAIVTVTLTQAPKPGLILTKFFPYSDDIEMKSTAVARGGSKVCVVALVEDGPHGLRAIDNSILDAQDCTIYSNSIRPDGVAAKQKSKIFAQRICSAGGYRGPVMNYNPSPTTDCPIYADPLKEREPPSYGFCNEKNKSVGDEIEDLKTKFNLWTDLSMLKRTSKKTDGVAESYDKSTLDPGVYCGGLTIGNGAEVTLRPGTYIIKDGPLLVGLGGRMKGTGVSFYLVGDDSVFHFDLDSQISISAEETGALAGILFFEDRNAPLDRVHRIMSEGARELIGTFYLPRGELRVATLSPVGDRSAYTAIVARRLSLAGSPKLVLNSNYEDTTVPVPAGVGPVGGGIFLRE